MAKPLVVKQTEVMSSFDITLLERSKIYGSRKRVNLDAQGRDCARAALTIDGASLLGSGMTGQGYFTDAGNWVSRSSMVGIDVNGKVVEPKASTLGIAQDLEGPVDVAQVLDLVIQSVYHLEPQPDASALVERLKAGEVFRCVFNFSAGHELETAYLVGNPEGIFAIVGQHVEASWVEEGQSYVPALDVEDNADELDFEAL